MSTNRKNKNYILQPKGKPLYNDSNNIGTKMLEKMGWSEGKGLGKNESGNPEFIRIKYKNSITGFGYIEKDDQWTEHEKEFSSLLNSLNSGNNSVDGKISKVFDFQERPKKVHIQNKYESLEQKSKNCRVRVHYKKFTKGKDLSQYSEKDLANIFGKKSLVASNSEDKIKDDILVGIEKNFNNSSLNSDSSIDNYFKQKLEQMKNKTKLKSEKCLEDFKCTKNNSIKRKYFEDMESNPDIDKNKSDSKHKQIKKKKASKTITEYEEMKIKKKRSKEKAMQDKISCIDNSLAEYTEEQDLFKEENSEQQMKFRKNKNIAKMDTTEKQLLDYKSMLNSGQEIVNLDNKLEENLGKPTNKLIVNDVSENSYLKKKKNIQNGKCNIELVSQTEKIKSLKRNSIDNCDSLIDKIQITEYCAEKFRHTDLDAFIGSNLKDFHGYGLRDNFKVSVIENKNDINLITKLWKQNLIDSTLSNKYEIYDERQRAREYKKKVKEAREMKKKIPDLDVKYLKKKSVFNQVKI